MNEKPGRRRLFRVFLLAFAPLCGCNKPADAPASAANAAKSEAKISELAPPATPRKTATRRKKSKASSGTHIGEIPKDVWPEIFFDEPLKVLNEKRPVAAAKENVPAAATPPAGDKPSPQAELLPAPPGSEGDWVVMLSGDELANECMAIRSSLTAKLQSVGKYSGNYKDVRIDAGTLAAFAGIAGEHPEAPSWKANARYVRDVAAEIVKSASANGDKFYKPTKEAFDKLESLLTGSKPPDLEEAAEKVPFSEVVTRVPLMYRMERAFNYMKLNVNTDALLKKESTKVVHEGSVLAALAKVVASSGYNDADLNEYQRFADELQNCGIGVVEAAKNGDFEAYTAALDRGHKACVQCHDNFKNN